MLSRILDCPSLISVRTPKGVSVPMDEDIDLYASAAPEFLLRDMLSETFCILRFRSVKSSMKSEALLTGAEQATQLLPLYGQLYLSVARWRSS